MSATATIEGKTRIDLRLSKEEKQLIELATSLGSYRSLTDFILSASQAMANKVVRENETIVSSKRDKEIFFNAIMNAEKPNSALMKAAKRYKKLASK